MATRATVTVESPFSDAAAPLLEELDRDLLDRYPRHHIHGVALHEVDGGQGIFVVARLDSRPVGCGAVRLFAPGVGEVKRMFVRPQARRRGIARLVLAKLEEIARERGLHTLRLETGTRQPEAIALYETHGYRPIPAFGEYVNDPFSVCFEKRL